MLGHSSGDEHGRPALLPGAIAEIEVLYISRFIDRVDAAERAQLRGIVERASAASVEHVAEILAGNGRLAAHGEILRRGLREHGLAGLLAPLPGRKADLRRRAKQIGHLRESGQQRSEETRVEQHVIVEQQYMRIAGMGEAGIYRARKT